MTLRRLIILCLLPALFFACQPAEVEKPGDEPTEKPQPEPEPEPEPVKHVDPVSLTFVEKGKNQIEIEVVNTWHNALRGLDQGKAPYEGIWTNAKYRTKGDGLLPAGLLRQPEIIIEK